MPTPTQLVMRALRYGDQQPVDVLAAQLARTQRTVRDTLNPLIAQGLVRVETVYSLTETGRQRARSPFMNTEQGAA